MADSFSRWRPHPWHGLHPGTNTPDVVRAYIEITPFDLVKYEIDKETGYLRVDRPQRGASQPPTLYGFVPRTFCGARVCELSPKSKRGDGDPIDICVLSERPITKSELIVSAHIVGGLQMIDNDEADDKLIAVLQNDTIWSDAKDIVDLPTALIDRLRHYFSTYKLVPPDERSRTTIEDIYGCERARAVLQAALDDYHEAFPD